MTRHTAIHALRGAAALSLAAFLAAPAESAVNGWPQSSGGVYEDAGQAIVVDSQGYVFTTGRFEGTATFGETTLTAVGSSDVFVGKKDSVGNWQWAVRAGGASADSGLAIAVDSTGNVFIAGTFQGAASFGSINLTSALGGVDTFFVARLDALGGWRWAVTASTTGPSAALGLAVNSASEAYVTGYFSGSIAFGGSVGTKFTDENHATDKDVFVAKLGDSGQWRWALRGGGDVTAVWNAPNCLPAGWCCAAWWGCSWFGYSENDCQYLLGSPDATANWFYGRNVCVPTTIADAYSDDRGTAIRVLSENGPDGMPGTFDDVHTTYVAGQFQGNFDQPAANSLRAANSAERQFDLFVGKIIESRGNGTDTIPGTADDVFAANFLWTKDADDNLTGGHLRTDDNAWATAIDVARDGSNGNVFVGGRYTGSPKLGTSTLDDATATGTFAFVGKLADGGNAASWSWAGTAGRQGTGAWAEVTGVAVDGGALSSQGVYVVGNYRATVDFKTDVQPYTPPAQPPATLANYSPGTTNLDVFAARYRGNDGYLNWARRGGGLFNDEAAGVDVDAGGTSFVAGRFQGVGLFAEDKPFAYYQPTRGPYNVSETSYSVSLWFKTTCANCGIFSVVAQGGGGGHDRHIYLENGNLKARVWNNEVLTAEAFVKTEGAFTYANFADGLWHHVVHVVGGGQGHKLYIDGVLRASGVKTQSDFNWQDEVIVGVSLDAGVDNFEGVIEDVQIFDSARTAADAAALFNAFTPVEDVELVDSVGGRDVFLASLGPNGPWRSAENWIIGQEVPRPPGALALQPEIRLGDEDGSAYFHWAPFEKKLFAIRPIAAIVRWKVSTSAIDSRRILTFGASDWPRDPQLHVAGSPADVQLPADKQPLGGPFQFQQIKYTTAGATVDTNKIFSASYEGCQGSPLGCYTVLMYLQGTSPDPTLNPVVFDVVRTVPWTDPLVLEDNVACTIGTRVYDRRHSDPLGKAGFALFERAAYDGVGVDRAYDRASRVGTIIPVNEAGGTVEDLVVVWYQRSRATGTGWGARALRYDCRWPAAPDRIVIASEKGSELPGQGPLTPSAFVNMRIYDQPNRTLPGFNPNDEHAMFWPSTTGTGADAIFALRSDLGTTQQGQVLTSRPYVLLKFSDPVTGEYRFRVYAVFATSGDYPGFTYAGTAGNAVFAPYPVRLMNACPETTGSGAPYWKDHKNQVYARSAVHGRTPAEDVITARYWYPLMPGFFYDLNGNGVQDRENGACVAWLDRLAPAAPPYQVPIAVTYNICWPDEPCAVKREEVPMLQVGETLTLPKRGLPNIKNQAASRIVFDESNPYLLVDGAAPPALPANANALAQLIDPFSERWVSLAAVPGVILTETDFITGRKIFPDLPYHLKVRLTYDPLNKRLILGGYINTDGAGEPLMLPNVLSVTEREKVKSQAPADTAWTTAVTALYHLARNPRALRLGTPRPSTPNQALLIGYKDTLNAAGVTVSGGDGVAEPLRLLGAQGALTAGAATGTGYLTLAFNDDPSLGALPVSLKVIKVGCGPYQGEVKVIKSDNVFDEKLTLRHVGDFGGDPDPLFFEWYTQAVRPPQPGQETGPGGIPPAPCPEGCPLGNPPDMKGWVLYTQGQGKNDITIEGADLRTLSDNWFLARYKGFAVCNNQPPTPGHTWSAFAGQPGSTPAEALAQLAPGWIKRVTEGLNPLDTRVKQFHKAPTNTVVSMISQLGPRFEGDIALNATPENLNSIGLIEAYSTVLNRGKKLSISGTPPVNYGPTNQALLLAASRLSDFYALLGNEAYADAQDPMIGFGTKSSEYGTLAPSIFTFQNQLDSLLDEELVLLRGRDTTGGGVKAPPVYNRLFWNFTNGDGEVAYKLAYNIQDTDLNGLDENDGKRAYPQGHGDAWGHYLTATKTLYDLLRHPYFTWQPAAEPVLLAGITTLVDYQDERKFARLAAAKARTGAEIVNLTYRLKYVDDPAGQWQGYKDDQLDRGWGFTEWSRRAGQAAYIDWVVANSILPAVDPNPAHSGITKIDRTTVAELGEIAAQYNVIQSKADEADKGLNPLGLAKGVIPFDIDPFFLDIGSGTQGRTHFEQIHERALKALDNAVLAFDHANQLSQMLRMNQDTLVDFQRNVQDQEIDFRNRLIEIFGYPYADDIGGAGFYPTGYNGPDLVHYGYTDPGPLTGDATTATQPFTGYLKPIPGIGYFLGDDTNKTTNLAKPVSFTRSVEGFGLVKPPDWTSQRRAVGELQRLQSNFLSERVKYEQALQAYDNHIKQIEDEVSLLSTQYNVGSERITILERKRNQRIGLNTAIAVAKTVQLTLRRLSDTMEKAADSGAEAVPKSVGLATDAFAPARGALKIASFAVAVAFNDVAAVFEGIEFAMTLAKDQVEDQAEIDLESQDQRLPVQERLAVIRQLMRQEPGLRLEAQLQAEVVNGAVADYFAKLAEGQRIMEDLIRFRAGTAADVQEYRYQDLAFRIFRNEALQKYRAQFDVAARYAFLDATAYDYETNLLGGASGAGQQFLTSIVKQRSIGQVVDGNPIAGAPGIADTLARLGQNFQILKGQLGFNNPQLETNRFSLRKELFRILPKDEVVADDPDDTEWKHTLAKYRVENLWDVPEFRRYARPFAPESAGRQPALVIPFSTTVTFGLNYFGWPLGGGDSAYDPSNFATRVRSAGLWFGNYDTAALSNTPRVYLIPVGADVLRAPGGDEFDTREWHVVDQALPVPFPIGASTFDDANYIPINDSLSESMGAIRRMSSFGAHALTEDVDPADMVTETRLIGRSVWNTRWLLIIPGGTLLFDPNEGLDQFIYGKPIPGSTTGERDGQGIDDIQILFTTYAYSGN